METDITGEISEYFRREIEVLSKLDIAELGRAVSAISAAGESGHVIWTMGNGGSAATASHMVCDLAKGVYEQSGKRKYDVRCLCDNVPLLMAIANDIGYENVFRYQLEGVMREGDLIIAISGSGSSENVVRACEFAKKNGASVVAMTGYSGGRLAEIADYNMHVPADDMQLSEDVHMIFDHMIMRVLGGQCPAASRR